MPRCNRVGSIDDGSSDNHDSDNETEGGNETTNEDSINAVAAIRELDDDVNFGCIKKITCMLLGRSYPLVFHLDVIQGRADVASRLHTRGAVESDIASKRKTVTIQNIEYFADVLQSLDGKKKKAISDTALAVF